MLGIMQIMRWSVVLAGMGLLLACSGALPAAAGEGTTEGKVSMAALERIPEALPGAPALDGDLRRRLAEKLVARAGEVPRTKHLREDGSPLPNLFAGGGAACGVSGPAVWGYLSGNGLLTAVTLGRIAGMEAARLARD